MKKNLTENKQGECRGRGEQQRRVYRLVELKSRRKVNKEEAEGVGEEGEGAKTSVHEKRANKQQQKNTLKISSINYSQLTKGIQSK